MTGTSNVIRQVAMKKLPSIVIFPEFERYFAQIGLTKFKCLGCDEELHCGDSSDTYDIHAKEQGWIQPDDKEHS